MYSYTLRNAFISPVVTSKCFIFAQTIKKTVVENGKKMRYSETMISAAIIKAISPSLTDRPETCLLFGCACKHRLILHRRGSLSPLRYSSLD